MTRKLEELFDLPSSVEIETEAEMLQRRNALEDEFITWITPPAENQNETTS